MKNLIENNQSTYEAFQTDANTQLESGNKRSAQG